MQSLALLAGVPLLSTAVLLAALAVGGLISVAMVLPVRVSVTPSSEQAVGRVIDELGFMRYVEVGARGNAVVYRQNLPRVLRWDRRQHPPAARWRPSRDRRAGRQRAPGSPRTALPQVRRLRLGSGPTSGHGLSRVAAEPVSGCRT
ncbi:hypothetical protein LP419_27490 [Massilia sp. H-1]|nr:hypothetical protein LP419_27490 [Massilia sp. H-1]